jgi:hypothetical protein
LPTCTWPCIDAWTEQWYLKHPDVGKTTVNVSPIGCTCVGLDESESKACAESESEVTEWPSGTTRRRARRPPA